MHTALNLRACPSSLSMHTLLAFVKGKVDEATPACVTGKLQAFLMAYGAEIWSACSLLPLFACASLLAAGWRHRRAVRKGAWQRQPRHQEGRKRASGRESGSKLHALQSFAPRTPIHTF